jgi:hypothetical protein
MDEPSKSGKNVLLFLDSLKPYATWVDNIEQKYQVVTGRDLVRGHWDDKRWYSKEDSELEESIREFTSNGNADYVIIGNNNGAGLSKAKAVVPWMRKNNSSIVWHFRRPPVSQERWEKVLYQASYSPGMENEYESLGYTKFMQRDELHKFLAGILPNVSV